MLDLLLATQNKGKMKEIEQYFSGLTIQIIFPDENFDVEETGTTFEENARLKAEAFSQHFDGKLTLADDSGLLVDALPGKLGVFTKRYGDSDDQRNAKLLSEMSHVPHKERIARFVSVMVLYGQGIDQVFRGEVEGTIALQKQGDMGFGFDPVFIPNGFDKTFAELGTEIKNTLSHRARAMMQVKEFLAQQVGTDRK